MNSAQSVSVIIPAYLCEQSLPLVLEGLLTQVRRPDEIIVVDDCSPDDIEAAVRPFGVAVIYLRNERNLGLSRTLNRGVQRATGDWILTLHCDCVLKADYLERLAEVAAREKNVGAVTGQYVIDNFDTMPFSEKLFTLFNLLQLPPVPSADGVHEISFVEGKADLFRKEVLAEYGYFNEILRTTAEDQDLSARMRRDGYRLLVNDEAHYSFRYGGTQNNLKKVMGKQRLYARGQAFILASHGRRAVRFSTPNRDARVLHRLTQLIWPISILAGVVLVAFRPELMAGLLFLLAVRLLIYGWIARWLPWGQWLTAVPLGVVSDFYYFYGFCEGMIGTFRKQMIP